MVHGVHNSGSDIQRLQQQQQHDDDLRADLDRDRDRSRTPSQNGSREGEWLHDSLSEGFNAHRLSDRGSQYLGRRVASHPEPSVHPHDPDETGTDVNALQRIIRTMRSELDELRQQVRDGTRDPATQGRQEDPAVTQAQQRLDRQRTLARLDQEMQDLELATKMQKAEDKSAEHELNRRMSLASTGYNLLEKGNRQAERLTS